MLRLIALACFAAAASIFAAMMARPCPTEDSNACTWYAAHQGNGVGRTFTSLEPFGTIYWN